MFVRMCPRCLNNPVVPFGIHTSFYFSLLLSYYFCIKLIFILSLPCPFIRCTLSCKNEQIEGSENGSYDPADRG